MRTSHSQYVVMVDYMEKNGDLSKPSGGPRGRHFIQVKWKDLVTKLNSDGSGVSRSEEKWRKVWSDVKNNTKKKLAKINRAASSTGGGPALQLSLTDLESRIMQIIGVQAVSGMAAIEAGIEQGEESVGGDVCGGESSVEVEAEPQNTETYLLDWNTPSTSGAVTSKPPPKKKPRNNDLTDLFVECDRSAKEYTRERDRVYEELERERIRQRDEELRLRELELNERVRQRDAQFQSQAQWQEIMKEALKLISKYLNKEK